MNVRISFLFNSINYNANVKVHTICKVSEFYIDEVDMCIYISGVLLALSKNYITPLIKIKIFVKKSKLKSINRLI